jgi:hypothetical protein
MYNDVNLKVMEKRISGSVLIIVHFEKKNTTAVE